MLGMEKNDEFYIGYGSGAGAKTKASLKKFVFLALAFFLVGAFLFAFFQKPAVNSSFDFGSPTKLTGVYHESPYPMLRVTLAEHTYKDILLLGFGKFGPNAYLKGIREEEGELNGKQLQIEGQLIYYNGKTLLEIDNSQKISLIQGESTTISTGRSQGNKILTGEVTDPKCYFGVMKPGYGKIHRSCAALCISGGVPPVLVAMDKEGNESYFLLTDMKGNPINKDILPYIGQPAEFSGDSYTLNGWNVLRLDTDNIIKIEKHSNIYN